MAKEDRKRLVLEVLGESGVAMPRTVLLRNVKFRGGRFERTSLGNYLDELMAEGLVKKIDPAAMEAREEVVVDSEQKGYFIATEAGRKRVETADSV
jgi:hypothetical protein